MNEAYQQALEKHKTPSVICCSRGELEALENSSVEKAKNGAYVVFGEGEEADLILIGSGTELGPCVTAAKSLADEGIKARVVSMPCQDIFVEQSKEYQSSVLPGNIPTLSVEASAEHGWHRFSHAQIGMTRFGLSAPANSLFKHFGFTASNISEKGKALVEFYKKAGSVPDLNSRPVFNNIMGDVGH